MDVKSDLQDILDLYKERYEKAKSLNISENSKHFWAFQEIEKRYAAAYFALELMELLPDKMNCTDLRSFYISLLRFICEQLVLVEAITTENGKKIYPKHKVKIKKENKEAIEIYNAGKDALQRLMELNFNMTDKKLLQNELEKDAFYIIKWMLTARELEFTVNQGKHTNIAPC